MHYKNTVFAGTLGSDHFEVYIYMENKSTIQEFLERLIDNSQETKTSWESLKKNNYRLLLKSGSVIFEITESGKSDTEFAYNLSLYDLHECFASYNVKLSYDPEQIFSLLEKLRKAIHQNQKVLEEKKIRSLYNDLL